MRMLQISFYFPPYNAIDPLRVGETAKYLVKFGYDVRDITAVEQPFQATVQLEIADELITYTPWINMNKPAEVFVGGRARVAEKGHEPQGPFRKVLNGVKTLYRGLYKSVCASPDEQIGWFSFD